MNRKLFVGISALVLAVCVTCSSVFADGQNLTFGGGLFSSDKSVSVNAVSSSNKSTTFSALSTAKNGNIAYEFEEQGYKNCLDYLLARDGFIYGIDYNGTLDVLKLGHCLGDDTITKQVATYSHSAAERDFYNIKALGFNCAAWWLMSDSQGMLFDDDGLAIGVQEKFITNLRDMLSTARKVGLAINPCLIPHGYCGWDADIYNKYFRYMWDEEALDALITNVIEPVCEVMSEYPDVVMVVSLNIENSTEMLDDYDKGLFQYGNSGTTLENYARYLNALNAAVKKYMPNTPTAMEQAGGADLVDAADERMYFQNMLDVDLISENVYHSGGWVEPVSNGYNTRPGFIGEYNTGETNRGDISQEYQASRIYNFNRTAKENGWLGAFFYSFFSGGRDFAITSGNSSSDYDSFYNWGIGFRYEIDDGIAEFKGVSIDGLAKANMLYYNGGSYVYWIPPRGAQSFTLQRSSDSGKTWTTIAENINSDSMISNGLIKYEVTDNSDNTNYMFRVISYNEEGASTVSEPTNEALYYIPKNLTFNSGFETTEFTEDGINSWSQQPNYSFTDEHAATGKYALKLDTVNVASSGYATCYQILEVEPNTVYKLDFKYLCNQFEFDPRNDYNEPISVTIDNAENNTRIGCTFMGATVGEDMADMSVLFSVGDFTTIRIKIMSGTGNVKAVAYFDDFILKEVR